MAEYLRVSWAGKSADVPTKETFIDALDSKLEVKVLDYTSTNLITREQLGALEPGIYDIKYDKNSSDAPCAGFGVNVQINTSFDPTTSTFTTSTIGFTGNDGVARVKVDYIWIGDYIQIGKRITAEGILGQNPGDTIGTFVDLFLNSSYGLVDRINDYALTSDLTKYKKADYVNDGITSTSPTVQLVYQSYSSIYQYSNVLTSLTITVPATPINIDQSIRLIFKATSATTITVPSGLYFRGDDCNDSYVFLPQDNKVYDIIITYDGFNYNGIVVGTPATR